ncbi:MAG: hypothetical protein ACI4YB_12715 [Oscillospiraceae bacterium]
MKKYTNSVIAAIMAAMMLTACGSNENTDEAVTETEAEITAEATENTTEQTTTTKATTTVTTTVTTEATTQTARTLTILSEDDLVGENKKIFEEFNDLRTNSGISALIPVGELNHCAMVLTKEYDLFTLSDATRKDGSSYVTIFDEENISYTNCEIINGLTLYEGYEGVVNSICFSRSALSKVTDGQWKYAGFYHDPKTLYWTMLLITDEGEATGQASAGDENSAGEVASYYDDSSAFAAFDTYMRSLVYDDYATYLAITHQTDSDSVAESYDYRKENYVGKSLSDIEYYEADIDPLVGGYANYKVSEFNSSGDVRMDINTMGTAYGTIIVEKDRNTQKFYVDAHIRFSPFFNFP